MIFSLGTNLLDSRTAASDELLDKPRVNARFNSLPTRFLSFRIRRSPTAQNN